MQITAEQIRKIATGKVNAANMNSVLVALDKYGSKVGLDQAHRLAHYIPQLMHESGSFRWDKEIWGPTAQQKKYEPPNKVAKTLGNTKKGDGKRYAGRAGIQITGRSNYRQFTVWVRKEIDPDAPDFEANPELINTDPWEGLVPIWYWTTRGLNKYADQNNAEMITRRINGGLTGYADRLHFYDRTALVLLGYGPTELKKFQEAANRTGDYKGDLDGEAGPLSRAALHQRLLNKTDKVDHAPEVKPAPVTEEKEVVPPKIEKEVAKKTNWLTQLFGAGGFFAVVGAWLADQDWQTIAIVGGLGIIATLGVLLGGQWMVRRIKAIRKELEA